MSLFASGCGDQAGPASSLETARTDSVTPAAIFSTASGNGSEGVLLYLEVARTDQEKSRGLMERPSLAPDRGMVFLFDSPTEGPFWMKNTYIPLSIAFVSKEGTIVDIQDMEPLTLDLHRPAAGYTRAIEANRGFFSRNGIEPGDTVRFEGI